jgi:hypothetical protein
MRVNISSWWSPAFVHGSLLPAIVSVGLLATPTTVRSADACTLLTSEEIATIVAERVRKARPQTAQEGTACAFPMASGNLNISLWPTDARKFDEFRKTLTEAGARLESTSGVGDAAYFWDDRIYVRVGNQGLTIWHGAPQDGVDTRRRNMVVAVAKAGIAKLR